MRSICLWSWRAILCACIFRLRLDIFSSVTAAMWHVLRRDWQGLGSAVGIQSRLKSWKDYEKESSPSLMQVRCKRGQQYTPWILTIRTPLVHMWLASVPILKNPASISMSTTKEYFLRTMIPTSRWLKDWTNRGGAFHACLTTPWDVYRTG